MAEKSRQEQWEEQITSLFVENRNDHKDIMRELTDLKVNVGVLNTQQIAVEKKLDRNNQRGPVQANGMSTGRMIAYGSVFVPIIYSLLRIIEHLVKMLPEIVRAG